MSEPKRAGDKPTLLELEPGKYAWCACGLSANQPLCDGSHKGSGLVPKTFEVTEKKKKAYCLCKQTGNAPFCDGSHSR